VTADYTIRVIGRLTPMLFTALDPLEASDDGSCTVLVARAADRSALHGFIARIEALGLELVELQRRPAPRSRDTRCPTCGQDRGADGLQTSAVAP
jgi:hypothetical protein